MVRWRAVLPLGILLLVAPLHVSCDGKTDAGSDGGTGGVEVVCVDGEARTDSESGTPHSAFGSCETPGGSVWAVQNFY